MWFYCSGQPDLHSSLIAENQFDQLASELSKLLTESTLRARGDSILLSGGLDTSIVAAIASKAGFEVFALTVILKGYPAPDLEYSKLICSQLGLSQETVEIDLEEIEASLPGVIRVLRTFDPMEIRNSVTVYLGLKWAASRGFKKIYTGDAADELFAGYSFITGLPAELAVSKLHHLWHVMHFSSIPLASSLNMKALLPFFDTKVRDFAYGIPFDFLVGKDKNGNLVGKYILRKAFEDKLPPEIVWRKKTPIEFGSGTTVLPQIYGGKMSDGEFLERKSEYFEQDHVRIRDKEQLHYYEIYRKIFGPPVSVSSKRNCPSCNSDLVESQNFCTTCGEFPV